MNLKPRYIPNDAQELTRLDCSAIVYAYTNTAAMPAAIAYYSATNNKPAFHYRFRNENQRAAYVEKFFNDCADKERATAQRKAEQKAAKAGFTNPIKPGDVLYASWGYDQTNIDFFQVIATTGKTVTFRPIMSELTSDGAEYMSGRVLPKKNAFSKDCETYTRPLKVYLSGGEKPSFCVPFAESKGSYQRSLHLHDGRPLYCSWYA